jgi:hypothetical protein
VFLLVGLKNFLRRQVRIKVSVFFNMFCNIFKNKASNNIKAKKFVRDIYESIRRKQ